MQTPKALTTLQGELADAGLRKGAAERQAEAAQTQLARLNRIELTRGPLATLAEARLWLAENPDAPALPDGLGDALAEARGAASLAATRLEAVRAQQTQAEARKAAIGRDEPADAADADLAKLAGALGDAATKRADVRARAAERDRALLDVAAALRDIGSDIPAQQAGSLVPTLPETEAARERIGQHTAASTTLALAGTRLEKAQAALDLLDAEAATVPADAPAELEPLLAEIRHMREPLSHAAELADAVRAAAAAERACLAQIPGWVGTARDLAGLAPNSTESYDRLAQAVAEAGASLAAASTERSRLEALRTEWNTALAALRQQPLPDEAALATARAERDRGWRLIYARAFAGAPDAAAEHAYGDGDALPMAFERHLRAADAVADARIGAMKRVEQAARLAADLAGLQPALEAANTGAATAGRWQGEAAGLWASACAALRLPADATLREVVALLGARQDAIEARRVSEVAQAAQAELSARHRDWAQRLHQVLEVPAGGLATLLPVADARLQAARSALKDALARDARRTQAQAEHRAATTALTAAGQVLAQWQTGWEATLRTVRRPPGESPAVTARVLGRLGEMDRHHRAAAGLTSRIQDMNADLATFTATVSALAARLGVAEGADAFATAEALIARRDAARSLAAGAIEAAKALAAADREVADADRQAGAAAAALAAAVAACGAADAEAAEKQIVGARERTRQEAARSTAEARLRDIGGGRPFDTLAAEVAALPHDRFDAERHSAEVALAAALQDAQAAAIELAELDRRYAADALATGASEAAEVEAATAAEMGRLLDEYLLLRVSSGMLGRALDRVEESAGPTGVQRVAAAFEAITDGAWTVRAGEGPKGETLLLAAERGAAEPSKQIDQLSEGTRDQLYLALRLVAIEAHVAAAPPLPFIVDDVLQTFDDARARAALQALVGLSRHVQVIVLTHHPHLLEVARDLPVHVQRL